MKWFLLLAIRAYWMAVPAQMRRTCLFRESCSRFVYRITREYGFRRGLKALSIRYNTCRPGYGAIQHPDGTFSYFLVNGQPVNPDELTERIVRECKG